MKCPFAAAFAFSVVVGFTSIAPRVAVQAQGCTTKDDKFGFLVEQLTTAYGLNTCVASNVGTIGKALVSTIFSSCGILDIYDLVKNQDLKNFFTLLKDIQKVPADISPLIYKFMAAQNDDRVDNLCDAFSGALGPCGEKLIPSLMPALQGDVGCCGEISDMYDLLNIVVAPDRNLEYFLVGDLVDGFNKFLCSKKGKNSCGLDMFSQFTTMYTVESFDFFQHMALPFMTIAEEEACSGLSGNPYKDTASQKSATTINFGCCVHHMRPFIQTIQNVVKHIVGDTTWDVASGMVSFTSPDGRFVDTLAGTMTCDFAGPRCRNPKGLTDDLAMLRPVGRKNPGKNDLIDTNCTLVDKCNGDKSVCSPVCGRGSVIVPEWLKSTLAYQRNLAYHGPFCNAQIPASHNSAITLADGFGNRDQLFNQNLHPDKWWSYLKTNNQMLSLTDQLELGIRFLEIDTHFFLDDLRTGHCTSIGSKTLLEFVRVFGKSLGNYGKFTWGADLMGCFPSVSGIKASEQPLTQYALEEVKKWLDANPTEFVVVYLDTGSDIKRLDKFGAIDTLLTDTFGDLLISLKSLDHLAANKWVGGSIKHLTSKGKRVLALANEKTTAAYRLYDVCTTEKYLSVKFIDSLPDANRQINKLTIYSNENWIRTWSDQLRYISLSATGELTRKFPVFLDAESIPKYQRWNLNLIALDNVDGAKMAAQVWSWAENEPSTTKAGAYVLMNEKGRWVASTDAEPKFRACWKGSANLAWSIIPFAKDCPPETHFTAPKDPFQNYLLHKALIAHEVANASLVINADLKIVEAPTSARTSPLLRASTPASSDSVAQDGSTR